MNIRAVGGMQKLLEPLLLKSTREEPPAFKNFSRSPNQKEPALFSTFCHSWLVWLPEDMDDLGRNKMYYLLSALFQIVGSWRIGILSPECYMFFR